MTLELVPLMGRRGHQQLAKAFIAEHHRHHKPPGGDVFRIGIARDGELIGVAMVGRPVARAFDDGYTLEVNRTCTLPPPDGKNANSMLYGACWRATKALGFRRLITYTQEDESGASLRAAGWRVVAELPARPSWADSSVKLRAIRDPEGPGGIQRSLWEAAS